MYWQFQRADREQMKLLRNSASQTGASPAMLRPRFEQFSSEAPGALNTRCAPPRRIGDIKSGPAGRRQPDEFTYVAAYPGRPRTFSNRSAAS